MPLRIRQRYIKMDDMGSLIPKNHDLYPLIDQLITFKESMERLKEKEYFAKKTIEAIEQSGVPLSKGQKETIRRSAQKTFEKDEMFMNCMDKFHRQHGLAGSFLEWVMERPGSVRLNKNYDSNESEEDKIIDAFIVKEDSMVRVQLKGMKMEKRKDAEDYRASITGKRNTQFIDKKTGAFNFDDFVHKLNDDYEILDYEVVVFRSLNERKMDWDYIVLAIDTKKLLVEKSKFELRKTRRDNMRYEYDYEQDVCKLVCNPSASSQICKEITYVCRFIKLVDAEILYCDKDLDHILQLTKRKICG